MIIFSLWFLVKDLIEINGLLFGCFDFKFLYLFWRRYFVFNSIVVNISINNMMKLGIL